MLTITDILMKYFNLGFDVSIYYLKLKSTIFVFVFLSETKM